MTTELASKLEPKQIEVGFEPLLERRAKSARSERRGAFLNALGVLAGRLQSVENAAVVEVIKSGLGWADYSFDAQLWAEALAPHLSGEQPADQVRTIVEILKYPAAADVAKTNILLHALVGFGAPDRSKDLKANLDWIRGAFPDLANFDAAPLCPAPLSKGMACPTKQ